MKRGLNETETLPIGVDFDGVMKEYLKGWNYGDLTGNAPVPDALYSLRLLMRQHPVFIHTARDPQQVIAWLSDHGFLCVTGWPGDRIWNKFGILLVTNHKHNASAYIDDRAVPFTDWDSALAELARRGIFAPELESGEADEGLARVE
ncbi:hypothetical protein [Streptomyces sp. 5-10]|uniref:hypothetical protein n=1 Tax=Streptomyces sp. 5-10 TaxID=878925 RepID=UPI00168BCC92|nr:hypothetical protein [Streptomyces sp. 5-10]MBD3004779.1 hypothetical protein [Streptomyces sp. 5-10]